MVGFREPERITGGRFRMRGPLWFVVWTQHTPLSPVPRVSPFAGREGCWWWLSGFGFRVCGGANAPLQSSRSATHKGAAGIPSASRGSGDPPAITRTARTIGTLPATGLRSFALALGGVSPACGVRPRWTLSPCLT